MVHSPPSPVALVTGGAVRVGEAIVRELASRAYRVAVHANTSLDRAQHLVEELRQDGHDAAAFGADLRDEAATQAMIDLARRHFGQLDALVNNGAIWSCRRRATILRRQHGRDLRVLPVRRIDYGGAGFWGCDRQRG